MGPQSSASPRDLAQASSKPLLGLHCFTGPSRAGQGCPRWGDPRLWVGRAEATLGLRVSSHRLCAHSLRMPHLLPPGGSRGPGVGGLSRLCGPRSQGVQPWVPEGFQCTCWSHQSSGVPWEEDLQEGGWCSPEHMVFGHLFLQKRPLLPQVRRYIELQGRKTKQSPIMMPGRSQS